MPRFFLSYAHADNNSGLVDRLDDRLRPLCNIATPEPFELWRDNSSVLVGERFADKILGALDEADYGLLLLSPNFLNSDFIRRHELPRILAKAGGNRVIPVLLRRVPWSVVDDAGIRQHLVFSHKDKPWMDMTTASQQDAFAIELFEQIAQRHNSLQASL